MGYDMYFVTKPDGVKEEVAKLTALFHEACDARDRLPKEMHGTWLSNEERRAAFTRDGLDARPPNAHPDFVAAQERVDGLFQAMRDAEWSYFRLNITGMSGACRIMDALGMVFDGGEHPEWPDSPGDGYYAWEDAESTGVDLVKAADVARYEAYKRDVEALLRWSPDLGMVDLVEITDPDTGERIHVSPGIPVHKFGSNDGWVVTPDEARRAVQIARGTSAADLEDVLKAAGWDKHRDLWDRWVTFIERSADHGGFEVH